MKKLLAVFGMALALVGCVTPTPGPSPDPGPAPTPTPVPGPVVQVVIPEGVYVGAGLMTYWYKNDPVKDAALLAANHCNADYFEGDSEGTVQEGMSDEVRHAKILARVKADNAKGITAFIAIANACGGGVFAQRSRDWYFAECRWYQENFGNNPMVIVSPLAEWDGMPGDDWVFNGFLSQFHGLIMINKGARPYEIWGGTWGIDRHCQNMTDFGGPRGHNVLMNTDGPVLAEIGEPANPEKVYEFILGALNVECSAMYTAYHSPSLDPAAVKAVGRAIEKRFGK